MLATRPVGRNASAMKYDILSALGVAALAADKHRQKLMLRLMVLITTRYNWQTNELSMGRAEIARLWSVEERTVKRELGKFRTLGWMNVKRTGARGRVTVYELDLAQVLGETRSVWEGMGSDFRARMEESQTVPEVPVDSKVVPLHRTPLPASAGQGDLWSQVLETLHARSPPRGSIRFRRSSAGTAASSWRHPPASSRDMSRLIWPAACWPPTAGSIPPSAGSTSRPSDILHT